MNEAKSSDPVLSSDECRRKALAGPAPTKALRKSASAPAALALLIHSTVSKEQFPLQRVSRTNAPPSAHRPQTSLSYQAFLPTPSELPPFGQQDREPTFFGLLSIDPSLQSEPVSDLPPPADSEPEVTSIQEVCRDHSSAELVTGRGW